MELIIRKVRSNEYTKTEQLTRKAFWNVYRPGCFEHYILHNLRKQPCYIQELDLAAIRDNRIIGHILTTKAKVVDISKNEHEVLCIGPLSVLSEFQNKGIGSEHTHKTISIASNHRYSGLILFGNPEYYHRFGFSTAKRHNISTKDGQNFAPFMSLKLQQGSLEHVSGHFFHDKAFSVEKTSLAKFEATFNKNLQK